MCVCLSSLIKVPTESFLFFLGEGLLVCLSAIVSNLTVNKPRALSDLPQKGCSFTFFPPPSDNIGREQNKHRR